MASTDWAELSGGLSEENVTRGVTAGATPPEGGGEFVYGFNSRNVVEGAVALHVDAVDFAPTAKGGSIRAALKRGTSAGSTGWSPFLFFCAGGDSVEDRAYVLGLEDAAAGRIVLRKASAISEGVPEADATNSLRRSDDTFAVDTWLHLRLDVVVNDNGDVVLKVFRNDLVVHDVDNPVWEAVEGMDDFIDDALGVNDPLGRLPYTSGYAGFGMAVEEQSRRAYFDHIQVYRQL